MLTSGDRFFSSFVFLKLVQFFKAGFTAFETTRRTPVSSYIVRQANWIALGHRHPCPREAGHSECSCLGDQFFPICEKMERCCFSTRYKGKERAWRAGRRYFRSATTEKLQWYLLRRCRAQFHMKVHWPCHEEKECREGREGLGSGSF